MGHDLRGVLRRLRRQPAFAVLVVLTLAVAIGLNATLFALLDALIHPDMAMANADRLYWGTLHADPGNLVHNATRDSILEAALGGERIARYTASSSSPVVVEHGDRYLSGAVARVSPNFFAVAGISASAGRVLAPADSADGAAVVIADSVARHLFGNASPVGATITLNGESLTVVGVMPKRAQFPLDNVAAWRITPVGRTLGYGIGYERLFRLHDGETPGDLDRLTYPVAQEIARRAGGDTIQVAFRFHPAIDVQFHYQRFHIAIALAVVAVLLVACFNLANLQLARAMTRRRELAVHVALGAGAGAMIRQAVIEAAVLALPSFVLGVIAVQFGAVELGAFVPREIGEFVVEPHLSWRVVAFSVIATAVAIAVMAVAPAISAARVDPNELLKSYAGTGQRRKTRRQYAWLVVLQLGTTLALASGAALMLRSAMVYNAINTGYETKSLVTGVFGSSAAASTTAPTTRDTLDAAARTLAAVEGVATATALFRADVVGNAVTVRDSNGLREVAAPKTQYSVVSSGLVATLGLRLASGGDFNEASREAQVLIDAPTAQALWPNADPIGREIKLGGRDATREFARVVGVVGARVDHERRTAFGAPVPARVFRGLYYRPAADERFDAIVALSGTNFVARASQDVEKLPERIRRQLISVANVRGSRVSLMDEASGLKKARESRRFVAGLFLAFAGLAASLLAVGIHGILAYGVAERRREIAVRIAIGATARDVVHTVLRESVPVLLSGIALGLLLTKFGAGLLASQSLEDDVFNAPLFAVVGIIVSTVVVGAAVFPSLRATRIAPAEGLRGD